MHNQHSTGSNAHQPAACAHLRIIERDGVPGRATDAVWSLHAADNHPLDAHAPGIGDRETVGPDHKRWDVQATKTLAHTEACGIITGERSDVVSRDSASVDSEPCHKASHSLQDSMQLGVEKCGEPPLDDHPLPWQHVQAGHQRRPWMQEAGESACPMGSA